MAENYITKAKDFAQKAHTGQFRRDGKPYFIVAKNVEIYSTPAFFAAGTISSCADQ
jgi:(p)ppGpp synthase/HD superfamily hydrolase